MNERDIHFQEFAELLRRDLSEIIDEPLVHSSANFEEFDRKITRLKQILAQRGYDLVNHALEFTRTSPDPRTMQLSSTEVWMKFIPDLTEWPKP